MRNISDCGLRGEADVDAFALTALKASRAVCRTPSAAAERLTARHNEEVRRAREQSAPAPNTGADETRSLQQLMLADTASTEGVSQ